MGRLAAMLFTLATLSVARHQAQAVCAASEATICGYVRESSTGRPIAGAVVTLRIKSLQLDILARSDSSGYYFFARPPVRGDSVRVRFIGYVPAAIALSARAGRPWRVDVHMTPDSNRLSELYIGGPGMRAVIPHDQLPAKPRPI